MAKNDGDIIDFLLSTLLSAVAWIFGLIAKLFMTVVVGLFKLIGSGIKALFNKVS